MQRKLAVAALATAGLLLIASWSGLIIVLDTVVVPHWALPIGPLFLAGALAGTGRRHRQAEPSVWMLPSWLTIVLAVLVVTGSALTVGAATMSGADNRVLEPPGPDGCRAVVRETSYFMSGGGDVYSVTPFGVGWRTGSWRSDDGYRPIAAGTYQLSWGTDGNGLLVLQGGQGDPIIGESMFEVRC